MLKVIIPKDKLIISEYTSSRSTKIDIDSTLDCKVDYIDSVSYAVDSTHYYPKYVYNSLTGILNILTSDDMLYITEVTVNFYSSGYLRDTKLEKLLK